MNKPPDPDLLPDSGPPAAEQRLADLSFELSAIPCFWVDGNGRFLRVNHAARELFGFSEQEFRDLGICDVNLLIPAQSWSGYWERLKSAGKVVHAGLHLQRNGGAVPGRVHASYAEFDGREYGMMSILDLTELQRSQEAGRETEWLFKQIASNTEDAFWVTEVDSFAVRYVSPAFERIWQRPCKELYQRPTAWLDTVLPEERGAAGELLEKIRRSEPVHFDFRIARPDGTLRWIRFRSFPVSGMRGEPLACGIAEDITLRKEAEIALQDARAELEARVAHRTAELEAAARQLSADLAERERISAELAVSEARYRQLTELSPDAILIRDEDRFVFANRAAAELFGASTPEQLIGRHADSHLHPESTALARERRRQLHRGEPLPRIEMRFLKVDGSPFDAEVASAPVVAGGRLGAQVVLRDITARKARQASRDEHTRILRQLATGAPRHEVLSRVVRLIEAQIPGGLGLLLLVDKCGKRLIHGACESLAGEFARTIDGIDIGPGNGPCGKAAHTGKPVVSANIETDPLWEERRYLALSHGLQACWSVPILSQGGEVLGTLATYFRAAREATPEELDAIQVAADLAGIALENWRAQDALRERTAQLQQVNEEMRKEIQQRIRIAEALRTSEEQFRSVAETSPEPIIIHSDFRVVFASRAAAKLYGASSPDELVGMDTFRFVHPDSHELVRQRIRANYSGKDVPLMELRNRRLDGRMIEVEAAAGALTFGGVPAAVVIVRDITRRKRAQAWREAQSRILELLATGSSPSTVFGEIVRFTEMQLNDGLGSILVLDPCGKRLRSGCCESLPDAYNREIDGIEIGPLAGSCGTAAFTGHPVIAADVANDPRWVAFRDIALAHGLRACWSVPVQGEQGKVLGTLAMYYREPRSPSPEEFEAIRVAAHLTGITIEHWQAQEALREREAEMKLAMEAARMGMWYWDVPGDRIHYSESTGPLYGLPRGEGHESTEQFLASVHPDDRERVARAIERTLKRDEEYQNEIRVIWPDGSLHWVANRGVVMRDEEGSALRLIGVAMDITARKQLESTVAQRQIELEHLSRLHLIDSMAANLAHELNQPLAAVQYTLIGALERASKRTMRKSDLAQALRLAQGQVERAAAIVERVREFARRRGPVQQKLPLLEILEESLALVRVDAQGRRVKLLVDDAPEKLEIFADRVQLQQVLVNLIRNGMEAMNDTPAGERLITVSASADGQGKVEVAVADRGRGIDAPTRQRLFRPFQTTRGTGLGLGLSICLKIVEAYGGRIWLEPNEHGGTTARFTLPRVQS